MLLRSAKRDERVGWNLRRIKAIARRGTHGPWTGQVVLFAERLPHVMDDKRNAASIALVRDDPNVLVLAEDNDVARLPEGGIGGVAA